MSNAFRKSIGAGFLLYLYRWHCWVPLLEPLLRIMVFSHLPIIGLFHHIDYDNDYLYSFGNNILPVRTCIQDFSFSDSSLRGIKCRWLCMDWRAGEIWVLWRNSVWDF